MSETTRLRIGDVSALTGILPGRIRHYESRGLIAPGHLDSGYRTFALDDLLRLLHIDLLRSLGMGLDEIRLSIGDRPAGLRQALEWHRQALVEQRGRFDTLIAAVDQALAEPEEASAAVVQRLAKAHRESLGVFGRLAKPLSDGAEQELRRLLSGWDLPVPGLFGQMLLPEPITDLLERLADTPGHEALFERLHGLAERVLHVVLRGDEQAADHLGVIWVTEQLAEPLPRPVAAVLREAAPRVLPLPVVRHGFLVWAESMSPLAARVLRSIESEAHRRSVDVLGAIVIVPGQPRGQGGRSSNMLPPPWPPSAAAMNGPERREPAKPAVTSHRTSGVE